MTASPRPADHAGLRPVRQQGLARHHDLLARRQALHDLDLPVALEAGGDLAPVGDALGVDDPCHTVAHRGARHEQGRGAAAHLHLRGHERARHGVGTRRGAGEGQLDLDQPRRRVRLHGDPRDRSLEPVLGELGRLAYGQLARLLGAHLHQHLQP
jgi:hypothetical protein